jgi:hypothetical protein
MPLRPQERGDLSKIPCHPRSVLRQELAVHEVDPVPSDSGDPPLALRTFGVEYPEPSSGACLAGPIVN